MYEFCTYFDHRYLPRALALVGSLRRSCSAFRLWALCLDDEARLALGRLDLPEVEPIALTDLERANPQLSRAKHDRSPVEYYFTCSPFLPSFILQHHPEVETITYLDADLFFFSDPAPLFHEMGDAAVAIIGHRFPARLRALEKYGVYNVGWLSFRQDARAFACLGWWQERCLEWCYDRVEEGRFADQKYLDDWPVRFPGTVVLQHPGAGVAPWNLETRPLRFAGRCVKVGDDPLVFFHFHGVKRVLPAVYDLGVGLYGVRPSGTVVRRVFGAYLRALVDAERHVSQSGTLAQPPHQRGSEHQLGKQPGVHTGVAPPTRGLRRFAWVAKEIVRRRYALMLVGFVP